MRDLLQTVKHFIAVYVSKLRWLRPKTPQDREDLEQSVAATALDLAHERKEPLDLTDPQDQERLAARLIWERKHQKRTIRGSVSLDETWATHDGGETTPHIDRLAARLDSDPLVALVDLLDGQFPENPDIAARDQLLALREDTYSELAAYITLLLHFEFIREDAARFLAVSPPTLDSRIRRAGEKLRSQPSFFDRLISISLDFWPRVGIALLRRQSKRGDSPQIQLPLETDVNRPR